MTARSFTGFELWLQVLRYEPGQQYKPHMDANGRMATILIYLAGTPQTLWMHGRSVQVTRAFNEGFTSALRSWAFSPTDDDA